MSVIGRFYLKQTKDGNLLGEFSNNKIDRVIAECANRVPPFKEKFEGEYISTWIEENEAMVYELSIIAIGSTYKLKWISLSGNNSVFYGNGMLVDGILIGDYRDFLIE